MNAGDRYMVGIWQRDESRHCVHCNGRIYKDRDSGYWLHVDLTDGQNGLYCTPEMWTDPSLREYARPALCPMCGR